MNRTGCQVLAIALLLIVIQTQNPADENCKTWAGAVCTKCYPSYCIKNSKCVVADQNCLTRDQSSANCGNCLSCYKGWSLSAGKCVVSVTPPSGGGVTPPVNSTPSTNATNPYCSKWSSCYCIDCYLGYYLKAGICVLVNPLCKTYNVETGFCLSCYANYTLSNNTCIPVPPINNGTTPNTTVPCANCAEWKNGYCCKCVTGYNLINGVCVLIPISGGETPNTTIPNTTVPTNTTNIYCSAWLSGVCISCYGGYYLQNGICTLANDLCATIDINTGLCLSCYGGYYLSGGLCLLTNSLCAAIDQYGNCVNCYSGYYLNLGQCVLVNPLCKTYDINTGYCLSCYEEYGLINNVCIISPYDTPNPPTTPPISGGGVPPVVGHCAVCVAGYKLTNGGCVLIPINNSTTPCSNSTNSNGTSGSGTPSGVTIPSTSFDNAFCAVFTGAYCSSCYKGYYLGSGICKLANIWCATLDQSNGDCLSCYSGYKLSASASGITCILA